MTHFGTLLPILPVPEEACLLLDLQPEWLPWVWNALTLSGTSRRSLSWPSQASYPEQLYLCCYLPTSMVRYYIAVCLCFVFACTNVQLADVLGSWKAVKVADAGEITPADLSYTKLTLKDDYSFVYEASKMESLQGTFELPKQCF